MPHRDRVDGVVRSTKPLSYGGTVIDKVFIALLANGHLLLEGVPGLAKTLIVRTFAAAMNLSFHRIQFTPDMLPADLIGTVMYQDLEASFHDSPDPILAGLDIKTNEIAYDGELQHLYSSNYFKTVAGAGYFKIFTLLR